MPETLLVQFGDECSRNVFFPPLDRRFRGTFDAHQLARHDPDAGRLVTNWPEPVLGQQLEIDLETGEAAVIEPLHAFPEIAKRIKGRGLTLAPARESVKCDLPTLLWYTRAAVQGGKARVVKGRLPEDIDESRVRKDLFVKPVENPIDKMAAALTAQAQAFNKLAEAIAALAAAKK